MTRRVRVGVERESAVHLGPLVEASDALTDAVVVVGESAYDGCALLALYRREKPLLRRQQQLADHVPVNAAEALVGEHRPTTPGERAVVEHSFVDSRMRSISASSSAP